MQLLGNLESPFRWDEIFFAIDYNVIVNKSNQNRPIVESAGIVVLDWSGREPTALCVSSYGMWDFPKGRLEKGETHMQAAIRELFEETSISVPTDAEIIPGVVAPPVVYNAGVNTKIATYFVANRVSKKNPFLPVNPDLGMPENSAFRWVPVSMLSSVMPQRLFGVISYVKKWIKPGDDF